MSVHHKDDSPQNAERRRFLEIAKKVGFTAAVVAGPLALCYRRRQHKLRLTKNEKDRNKRSTP
nr:hypothetical protein [Enterovibrio nigricans]